MCIKIKLTRKSWCPVIPPQPLPLSSQQICSHWYTCSPNPREDITILLNCQFTTQPLIHQVHAAPNDT